MNIPEQQFLTDTAVVSSLVGLSVSTVNEYLALVGFILAIPLAILRIRLAILDRQTKLAELNNKKLNTNPITKD